MSAWRGMAAGTVALVAVAGFAAAGAAQGKGDPKAGETLYKNNKPMETFTVAEDVKRPPAVKF